MANDDYTSSPNGGWRVQGEEVADVLGRVADPVVAGAFRQQGPVVITDERRVHAANRSFAGCAG